MKYEKFNDSRLIACWFWLTCLFSSFQAVTDEQKQIAEKVGKDCAGETGLTAEEVQKIRSDPKSSVSDPKAQVIFELYDSLLYVETHDLLFKYFDFALTEIRQMFLGQTGFY